MSWVRVGELGALIEALKEGGVGRVLLLGGIDKRRAIQTMRLDARGLEVVRRLKARGDDALLGAFARELEGEGIEVLDSRQWLSSWLTPEGVLTEIEPSEQQQQDVALGISVLDHIGSLDIGQTVVVKEGVILAVEAIEGTDEAILRGGRLGGSGSVVVKGSKPMQDLRFDVPVVGPATLERMVEVGARVLALEAGRTFLLDRERMCQKAVQAGICILGWSRGGETDG